MSQLNCNPSAFDRAIARVFAHEGGYVDHPHDPGGATNRGITLKTLAKWRGVDWRYLPKSEVYNLTADEAKAIYKARYWDSVRGDDLPAGLAYAMFDYGVNSGPRRAIIALQSILGVTADGIIGGMTLRAIRGRNEAELIRFLQSQRLSFMQRLRHWRHFARGWTKRVDDVRREALALAAESGGQP